MSHVSGHTAMLECQELSAQGIENPKSLNPDVVQKKTEKPKIELAEQSIWSI